MRVFRFAVAVFTLFGLASTGQAAIVTGGPRVLNSNLTNAMPIVDGSVGSGEWDSAGFLPDNPGLAGATYAQWTPGLTYNTGSYSGRFSFLLHNIEQNTTFGNGVSGLDPAYNVFDIFKPEDSVNKYLEITVRYDGFTVDKYNNNTIVDTRTFNYGVGLAPHETPNYDWDNYFGVYAKGGFNNSAFEQGLPLAINNNNQLFEVAYRTDPMADIPPVRRSVKDPDQLNNWQLVEYIDVTVCTVPEPASFAILCLGTVGVVVREKLRRKKVTSL